MPLKFKSFYCRHTDTADEEINGWLKREKVTNIKDTFGKFAFDRDNKPAMLFFFIYETKVK